MKKYGIDPDEILLESTNTDVQAFQNFVAKNQKFKVDNLQPQVGQSYIPMEIMALILGEVKRILIVSTDEPYELTMIQNRLFFKRPDGTITSYPRASIGWNKAVYLFDTVKDKQKFLTLLGIEMSGWTIEFGKN